MSNIIHQLITFSLITIPVVTELVGDRYRTVVRKLVDNHKADMYIRALLIIAVSYINYIVLGIAIVKTAFLAVTWFWLWFDYTYNLITNRKFFYLGTSSWLDRKLREINPLVILFAKIWLFGLGIGVYYYWDRVINNWHPYFK